MSDHINHSLPLPLHIPRWLGHFPSPSTYQEALFYINQKDVKLGFLSLLLYLLRTICKA